jgi:uncharacterized protein
MRERPLRVVLELLFLATLATVAVGSVKTRAETAPVVVGNEITFTSGRNTLAGSIFLPDGPGPFPAVVFIVGAGDASYRRWWEGSAGGYLQADIRKWLVERGYAVLLFDKPGVGRSTGNWRKQSFDERTRDAMEAVRLLAARDDVDPARIGVIGHSQGGWVAIQAAVDHRADVAFVVLLAGPAEGVNEQVRAEMDNRWRCAGASVTGMRRVALRAGLGALSTTGRVVPTTFLSRIVRFDPASRLERIEQPVLALYATDDWMVDAEPNLARLQRHFGRRSGNISLWTAVVDGANHWFGSGGACPGERAEPGFLPGFWNAFGEPRFWAAVEGARGA